MRKLILILVLQGAIFFDGIAQLRVGDPGVTFDQDRFDDVNFPQIREWVKAGVIGGIPFLSDAPITKTLEATNSAALNAAIVETANQGGGQVLLKNGIYTIDEIVFLKSNVRLVGESREEVIFNITMQSTDDAAIKFVDVQNAGIDNLTIQGGYGQPNDFTMENSKPEFTVTGVNMDRDTKNCWLDKVTILNIGNSAVSTWRAEHITFRDMYVERSWNKGGGGRGYFSIQGSYTLVYNCTVKKMRHFVLQREGCFYNVVYQNNIDQDVNFHNHDMGNNLIEQNIIRIQSELKSEYHALMGPWSVQHAPSEKDNYAYRYDCIEHNNGNKVVFSDPNKVYLGARDYEKSGMAWVTSPIPPTGGTLYPVIAEGTVPFDPITSIEAQTELNIHPNPFHSSINISNFDDYQRAILINSTGKVVANVNLFNGQKQQTINLKMLESPGIYLLKLLNENKVKTVKILRK